MNTTTEEVVEITERMDKAMEAAQGASVSLSVFGFFQSLNAANAAGFIDNWAQLLGGEGVPLPGGDSTTSTPMENAEQLHEEIKDLFEQTVVITNKVKRRSEYYLRIEVLKCCKDEWSTEIFDVKRRKWVWTKLPRGTKGGAGYWSEPMPWRRPEDITRAQYNEAKERALKIACDDGESDGEGEIWVKNDSGRRNPRPIQRPSTR